MYRVKDSLEDLALQIEVANEAFMAMSPEEQRVVVAQDALSRMHIGQIVPYQGSLINLKNSYDLPFSDAKTLLNKQENFECTACAKGGLLLALIGRTNKFASRDLAFPLGSLESQMANNEESIFHEKLYEIFEPRQLMLIEAVFERGYFMSAFSDSDDRDLLKKQTYDYYDYFHIDNNFSFPNRHVFMSIMLNIIKHGGEFDVTDIVDTNEYVKSLKKLNNG